MKNLFNNSEILELVEEEIEKVADGKIDVKKGATRVLATALSALSVAGGVITYAMKPHRDSAPRSSNGSYTAVFVPRQLGEYKSTLPPERGDKEFGIFYDHFSNFKIHSDEFWNEDVRPLLAFQAREVITCNDENRLEALQEFQSVLNEVFEGNYHFSGKILYSIATKVIDCIEKKNSVTRRDMLFSIKNNIGLRCFSKPSRNRLFRPNIYFYKEYSMFNDFPLGFLSLPQVEKEFSFPSVRRNTPYDSMLAYLSDIDYMQAFLVHTNRCFSKIYFKKRYRQHVKFIDAFKRYESELLELMHECYKSPILMMVRYRFYKVVDFLKAVLGTDVVDLFESFNNYDYY